MLRFLILPICIASAFFFLAENERNVRDSQRFDAQRSFRIFEVFEQKMTSGIDTVSHSAHAAYHLGFCKVGSP